MGHTSKWCKPPNLMLGSKINPVTRFNIPVPGLCDLFFVLNILRTNQSLWYFEQPKVDQCFSSYSSLRILSRYLKSAIFGGLDPHLQTFWSPQVFVSVFLVASLAALGSIFKEGKCLGSLVEYVDCLWLSSDTQLQSYSDIVNINTNIESYINNFNHSYRMHSYVIYSYH